MPKKKKAKEEVFHVEVITKARVTDDGEWEYLVKWADYDSEDDSWEPSENVEQCDRLLKSFWRHIGMDNNDYHPGYEVAAKRSWIVQEKRFFLETFGGPSKEGSDTATKMEKRKSNSNISQSSADDYDSLDEESSGRTPLKMKFTKKARVIDTDSESESDGHLREQTKALPKAITLPSKEIPKAPVLAKRQEVPPATGGSLAIPPPKVPVVRTHQDQRVNPLVKSISLPSASVEAGSSLSTKQRVAAGILPPPTGPKPLPLAPKKSLPPLSFKKNKPPPPVSSSTQMKDTAIPSTSVVTPTSPVAQPTDIINEAIASPQPMDIDQPMMPDHFGSILDEPEPLDGIPEAPTVHIPPKSQVEIHAEEFLKTVNLPMLSAPLEMDVSVGELEQPTTELPRNILKIPKKWRWSGDLFISTSGSNTELLCTVTIVDPSGISNSSHINLLLSSLDSLQISKLYPIMDLSPLLRACGKSQYFGRLEPDKPSDEVVIGGLEHYLTSEGLAAAIPLLLDGAEVAVLIVFPRVQQGLTKVLQVPEHLQSGNTLLVVLLPFLVSSLASTEAIGCRSIQHASLKPQDDQNFPQEAILHQTMSLLCFPRTLLDFFNTSPSSRPYCIWPTIDQSSLGLDTTTLQSILKSTKATSAKLEEDVRVIFISNRYLDVLHTMPSLVAKRSNSPEIQFWTYGYSADLVCERWKVQEIYPLGGIVTFTSSALVEDLIGCCQLISQIIEHPLWDCYFIPEVLAVSYLLCTDGDQNSPSAPYLDPILDLIDLGLISVVQMPKNSYSDKAAWLSQVFNNPTASGRELLEVYIRALKSQHVTLGMTAEQLSTFTNNEITEDLLNAQIQPALMEKYRRFVVIKATSEDAIPFDKDGLEWVPLSQFGFKDNYFEL